MMKGHERVPESVEGPQVSEPGSSHRELLLVNGREIPVALVRSHRARRYVLRLRADGLARLTIPRRGSAREAWAFAQKQRAWLERQLQHFASRPFRPAEWLPGSEILFRGRRLKIEPASPSVPEPISEGRHNGADFFSETPIQAASPSNDPNGTFPGTLSVHWIQLGVELIQVLGVTGDLRPAIERHLRALATNELPARTFEFAALHQLSVRRVTVRAQRSRWGSCSFHGVISLNWRLIQTPPFVRDYIILHELMHLRQMNHSARFWSEVERVCPDYRDAKLWLKTNPGLLDR